MGQENHTAGHPFHCGVWVDGQFRWVDDDGWQRTLDYARDTLVTQVTLHHPDLSLRLICQDVVDFHEDLYLRRIVVHNEADREREVRLFFAQDFHISGHADFAPSNLLQVELLRYLQARFEHVSCERVCSSRGLPNIYAYLKDSGGFPAKGACQTCWHACRCM